MSDGWLWLLTVSIVMVCMLVWGCWDARPVLPSVVEMCPITGQDVFAGFDHVSGERELLAIEDKEISLFVICLLARPASPLTVTDSVFLDVNLEFARVVQVCYEILLVKVAVKIVSVLFNTVLQVGDTVLDVDCRVSQSLKSDH